MLLLMEMLGLRMSLHSQTKQVPPFVPNQSRQDSYQQTPLQNGIQSAFELEKTWAQKQRDSVTRNWEPMWHRYSKDRTEISTEARNFSQSSGAKGLSLHSSSTSSSDSVNLVWMKYYASNRMASTDLIYAAAADRNGNIYVTGITDSTFSFSDVMTMKYSPSGTLLWKRRYTSQVSNEDFPNAITVDSSGNVYVTGQTFSWATLYDFVTIKYSTNGDLLWVRQYDGGMSQS